jgi:hypothetical protein
MQTTVLENIKRRIGASTRLSAIQFKSLLLMDLQLRLSGLMQRQNGWETCPVPALLGIPLVAKKNYREYKEVPPNQLAVYMMVDSGSGLAPAEWQELVGQVALARTDGVPLTTSVFYELYDYIYTLMDRYSDTSRHLSPQAYQRYTEESRRNQMEYQKQMEEWTKNNKFEMGVPNFN